MLHLQKKLEHKYNDDKNMVELDTIVIILIKQRCHMYYM